MRVRCGVLIGGQTKQGSLVYGTKKLLVEVVFVGFIPEESVG